MENLRVPVGSKCIHERGSSHRVWSIGDTLAL